ncbi:MAG: D-Ala-D-Ala carboxypeptidase family metallohydrolase, partial [Pseudomonadota bacterium]
MALEPLRLLRDAQERLQPPVRRPMPPREAEAPYQPFEPLPKNATPSDVRAAAVRWWTLDGARWAERWPDFPPRELACRANADNVKADAGLVYMHPRVLDALQAMRDDLRVPLVVTSAYRAPRYNAWVGGAKNSQHM